MRQNNPLPPGNVAPIGVFDSGLGGLSILMEMEKILPREKTIYLADNLHLPYGAKPLEEVRHYTTQAAEYLIEGGVKILVLACNSASAAALMHLRALHPEIPIVGMAPAVKPAAEKSISGKVGVLATEATLHGDLFAGVVERFASEVEVYQVPCPGLADFIENRSPADPALAEMLEGWIGPLRQAGVDKLVLGCTHYSLVKKVIQTVAGPGIELIDPSPAVARRVKQVLTEKGILNEDGEAEGLL